MRIINLTEDSNTYTSNVYFIRGEYNGMEDVNTIIDPGRDPSVFNKIKTMSTGAGKKKVEKVIITHSHFDHNAMVPKMKKVFGAEILAYNKEQELVDKVLKEGIVIKAGDRYLEVIYTPGHSFDSICLWEPKQGILFTGDMNLQLSKNGTYEDFVVTSLRKLARLSIKIAYPGHGGPIEGKLADKMIMDSIINTSP